MKSGRGKSRLCIPKIIIMMEREDGREEERRVLKMVECMETIGKI